VRYKSVLSINQSACNINLQAEETQTKQKSAESSLADQGKKKISE
jgi:hypothetical protein